MMLPLHLLFPIILIAFLVMTIANEFFHLIGEKSLRNVKLLYSFNIIVMLSFVLVISYQIYTLLILQSYEVIALMMIGIVVLVSLGINMIADIFSAQKEYRGKIYIYERSGKYSKGCYAYLVTISKNFAVMIPRSTFIDLKEKYSKATPTTDMYLVTSPVRILYLPHTRISTTVEVVENS